MKKRLIALLSLLICLGSLAQFNVFARAGGGGGHGGGGGGGRGGGHSHGRRHSHGGGGRSLGPLETLCVLGCSGLVAYGVSTISKKRAKRKIDASGLNYKRIVIEISDAYFAIQKAWAGGDMTPARRYMTQRLFENHQKKLAKMAKSNKKNICEDIELLSVTPWRFSKNGFGKICVKIEGRMIDYIIRTPKKDGSDNFLSKSWRNVREMVGNCSSKRYKPECFAEFWTFIKNSQGHWQLDRISPCNNG